MTTYTVSRTSVSSYTKPCEEAVQITVPYYDVRTFRSFQYHQDKLGYSFLDKGTEHKELPDGKGISRRMEDELAWSITINTLEELQAFITKYDEIIMTEDSIEIYDSYRE